MKMKSMQFSCLLLRPNKDLLWLTVLLVNVMSMVGVAKDLEEALTWYKMAQDEGIDVDEHIERIKSQKPRGFFSTLFDL